MTQEKADLINRLIELEDQIQDLWEFHPDNPDVIDVVTKFNDLQREAHSIESYLETLWTPEDEEDVI